MGPIKNGIGQLVKFTKTPYIITCLFILNLLIGHLAMSLSSKSKTAITAMVDLAINQAGGPVSLVSIAQRQNVSLSRLEQIFRRMRQEGLVTSVRGPGGGYSLCRPAAQIHIVEVARFFDNTRTYNTPPNNHITHELWSHLTQHMFNLLQGVTLQSLVDKTPPPQTLPKAANLTRGIAHRPSAKPLHLHIANSVFALGNLNRS